MWSGSWRTADGLVGFLLPIGYSMLTDRPFFIDNGLVLILAGYLLGAMAAEIVLNRSGQRAGAALLVPRRLENYLPRPGCNIDLGLAPRRHGGVAHRARIGDTAASAHRSRYRCPPCSASRRSTPSRPHSA